MGVTPPLVRENSLLFFLKPSLTLIGEVHLAIPALNLSTLNVGILIMIHQER